MTIRPLSAFLVLAAVVSLIAGSDGGEPDKGKAAEAELKRLEGEWRIVAAEQGGQAVESDDLVVFSGQKCTITNPATKLMLENTFTIDPSKTPKRIVVTNAKTKQAWAGIYELKGDALRALFYGDTDAKAPAEFKTREGSQEVMYTYERVKRK